MISKECAYLVDFINEIYHDSGQVTLTKEKLKAFFDSIKHKATILELAENN